MRRRQPFRGILSTFVVTSLFWIIFFTAGGEANLPEGGEVQVADNERVADTLPPLFDTASYSSDDPFTDDRALQSEGGGEVSEVALGYSDLQPGEPAFIGPVATVRNHDFTIKSQDSFYNLMASLQVPPKDILAISKKSKKIFDLRRLRAGDKMKVALSDDGTVDKLEYRYKDLESLLVERDESERGGFKVSKHDVDFTVRTKNVRGTIDTSLFEAGLKAGANPRALMDLTDIFAWDIDFATDLRKGDTFKLLYETIEVDGLAIKTGKVLGAEMVNKGRKFTAVYYIDGEQMGDYYDLDGKSLSRTLLRSPLRYRRISSHYNKNRRHPITKRYTPHHGIDYAAPKGTPVESSGSGKVVFAGWKGGYGNFIVIRHNSKYTTAYGHLSKIAKGIKKGVKVAQGQVIGKVGSTGLSTGPHLHYEVRVHGEHVNPLKIKSTSRKYVAKVEREAFGNVRDSVTSKIDSPAGTMFASGYNDL